MNDKICKLSYIGTFKLCIISFLTYFIYAAHYVKRQTRIINNFCKPQEIISEKFINFILINCYAAFVLFFTSLFLPESHPVTIIGNVVDQVANLSISVWGLKAGNRLNKIMDLEQKPGLRFHQVWSFLISPLYFNYQINLLKERGEFNQSDFGKRGHPSKAGEKGPTN